MVDMEGEKCNVGFKTQGGSSAGRYFAGQADLNGDGLSDVILIDYGDYGGMIIFREINGKWFVIRLACVQPC